MKAARSARTPGREARFVSAGEIQHQANRGSAAGGFCRKGWQIGRGCPLLIGGEYLQWRTVDKAPPNHLGTELEQQRHEIAELQERVKALAAKRKSREAMAQQVRDRAIKSELPKQDK